MAVSANRLELLQIADAVAREKSIDRMIVIASMQDAIEKAAKIPLRRRNRRSAPRSTPRPASCACGACSKWSRRSKSRPSRSSSSDAHARNGAAKLGDFVTEPLPPIEFGRIAAQSAKQVIVQKVRDAERERMYDEYINRVGEIVNGTVKRVEYGNVIVDLGRGEAIIRRDELIPREMYRYGDRVRAYIYDVRREQRGPQIFLSPHPSAVHGQAVHAGSAGDLRRHHHHPLDRPRSGQPRQDRRDLATTARSIRSAPASVCAASRVQAVVGELQGEKIDIIPWTDNIADLVVSALQPADVAKVVLDEQAEKIEVVVPDEQLQPRHRPPRPERAPRQPAHRLGHRHPDRGRRESERRQKEFTERSALFMQALDVDEMVAQLLASEGFSSVEQLAYIEVSEIASIQGFDEETAAEIQHRATDYLAAIEHEPTTKSARRSASPTSSTRSTASTPRCSWRSARKASRRSRILPATPPTIWSAGPNARTAK